MTDFENKDFWPIDIDFDDAQQQYDQFLKDYELENWQEFQNKLQTALQTMDSFKLKSKRLSNHQVNSVLQNKELRQRFEMQYLKNYIYFYRRSPKEEDYY